MTTARKIDNDANLPYNLKKSPKVQKLQERGNFLPHLSHRIGNVSWLIF